MKTLNAHERRKQILELASTQREVSIEQLQSHFNVSEVTLRRDLDILELEGHIRRIRGGAVLNNSPELEVKFQEKLGRQINEKQEIAKAAAALVKENQVVMLSGGTTTMYIARELCQKRGITVVTPAINIAAELAGYDSISLVIIGGVVRRDSYVASGHIADEVLASMHADYAFIGVDGVDLKAGFTTPSLIEGRTDSIMLQAATQSVIVADHSKFGQVSLAPIAKLGDVAQFITDSNAPSEYLDELRRQGCKVFRASEILRKE